MNDAADSAMSHGDASSCGRCNHRRNTGQPRIEARAGEASASSPHAPKTTDRHPSERTMLRRSSRDAPKFVDQLLWHRCTWTLANVDELGLTLGHASTPVPTSASCTTTSASCTAQPAYGQRSGSPGPAPTNEIMQHRNHHGAGRRVGRFVDKDQATSFSTDLIGDGRFGSLSERRTMARS